MPKSWRKCSLCEVNSMTELVIFNMGNKNEPCYICERHFLPEDMREHADTKR